MAIRIIRRAAAPVTVPEPVVRRKSKPVGKPLDGVLDAVLAQSRNMLVPWFLMSSWLYYHRDVSLLTDERYDRICQQLDAEWDDIEHDQAGDRPLAAQGGHRLLDPRRGVPDQGRVGRLLACRNPPAAADQPGAVRSAEALTCRPVFAYFVQLIANSESETIAVAIVIKKKPKNAAVPEPLVCRDETDGRVETPRLQLVVDNDHDPFDQLIIALAREAARRDHALWLASLEQAKGSAIPT